MKQHILPKQFKEMDEDAAIHLFDLVPREDWYKYHHKKVTIGKMIEVLERKEPGNLVRILLSYEDHIQHSAQYNLCDRLWEYVKNLR